MVFQLSAQNQRIESDAFNDVAGDQLNNHVQCTVSIINQGSFHFTTTEQHKSSNSLGGFTSYSLIPKPTLSSVLSIIDVTTNLIVQIIDSLPAERFVQLRLRLHSLHQTQVLVRCAIQAYKFSPLEASLAKAVFPLLAGCHNILQNIFDSINHYRTTLLPTRISIVWLPVWRSGIDVEQMETSVRRLLEYQTRLNGFLQALNSYVVL